VQRPGVWSLFAIFGQFISQSANADLKQFRSLGSVPVGFFKGIKNRLLFEFVEGQDLPVR
jgi:hypothetical protein